MSITRPELPGGPADRRPMHFFWLLDGSNSMTGEKIAALNFAVAEAIPGMRRAADDAPEVRLMVQVLRFATGVDWIVPDPTPIAELQWHDISASGDTAMGKALDAVVDQFDKIDTSRKYFAPVIILVTDGKNTDGDKVFEDALHRLMTHPVGRRSTRFGIAIGADVDVDKLKTFIGNDDIPVFESSNADTLAEYIRFVSTSAIKIASQPNTGAVAKEMADAPTLSGGGKSQIKQW
jgi:uncharacterized protein YegL